MAQSIGVNFRAAVENSDIFPNVAFVDKSEDIEVLFEKIKKLI